MDNYTKEDLEDAMMWIDLHGDECHFHIERAWKDSPDGPFTIEDVVANGSAGFVIKELLDIIKKDDKSLNDILNTVVSNFSEFKIKEAMENNNGRRNCLLTQTDPIA